MKTVNISARLSLIFEYRQNCRAFWVIWPSLIYFPPGTDPDAGDSATDWTLGWLKWCVSLRIKNSN